jgi:hypothetical protein
MSLIYYRRVGCSAAFLQNTSEFGSAEITTRQSCLWFRASVGFCRDFRDSVGVANTMGKWGIAVCDRREGFWHSDEAGMISQRGLGRRSQMYVGVRLGYHASTKIMFKKKWKRVGTLYTQGQNDVNKMII